eukprot:1010830-Pelagomonas_calceolata.AAC.1
MQLLLTPKFNTNGNVAQNPSCLCKSHSFRPFHEVQCQVDGQISAKSLAQLPHIKISGNITKHLGLHLGKPVELELQKAGKAPKLVTGGHSVQLAGKTEQ